MNKNITKHSYYQVQYADSCASFVDDGWSGYHDRWRLKAAGKVAGPVYGLQQAKEHLKELRAHVHCGRRPYANAPLRVVRVDTIRTTVYDDGKGAPA